MLVCTGSRCCSCQSLARHYAQTLRSTSQLLACNVSHAIHVPMLTERARLQRRCFQSAQGCSAAACRPRHACIATNASRRDAVLGTLGSASLYLLSSGAHAATEAAVRPKPFCGVVDMVPGWAYSTPWQEDIFDFAGGKTWYRYVNYVPQGKGLLAGLQKRYSPAVLDKLPLLIIAGGPGLPVSYLETLELMAGVGRRVVFYDQVGCGNTFLASNDTCPPVEQLTLDLYLQQIDAVRQHLGLDKCHLYGQGTGGMLALTYAASKQGAEGGIVSVSVASIPQSYQQLIADRQLALRNLGTDIEQQVLAADELGSLGGLDGGNAAWQQYMRQYVCSFPAALAGAPLGCARSALQRRSQPVYQSLAGSRYMSAAGDLAGWDAESLKPALQDLPLLVSRGDRDEVSDASAKQLIASLPRSKLVTVKGAASYVHIDNWEPHLTAVEEHLCAAEGSKPPTAA